MMVAFAEVALLGGVSGFGVLLLGVHIFQRHLQYQPSHADPLPQARGLAGVQVIALDTPDGVRLVMWYAPAVENRPTILFFHGNSGEMADRAARLAHYQSQGFGAAFLSYRGFGGSQGSISEAGLLTDARTAYDWLRAQAIPASRIVLVGESLGTGVAVQLAAQVPVDAVALDAPYASTLSVAQRRFPFLPVRWLMRDQFLSIDHIAKINACLLIQHGTADWVIPFASGQTLFAAALQPKTFLPHPGRGHDIIFASDTWAAQIAFFTHLLP